MIDTKDSTDRYQASFQQRETALSAGGQAWFLPTRQAAMSRFGELGFPTTRHEEWQHTSVAPIARTAFQHAAGVDAAVSPADVQRLALPGGTSARLVFVNGWYAPRLSDLGDLPAGVRVGSLDETAGRDPALLEPHLARHAAFDDHAFVALNTALMQDGGLVYVPRHTVVERPVELLFIATPGAEPRAIHPRNLVLVDADSQVTLVETHATVTPGDGAAYFNNPVTEIVAGDNSVVDHYKVVREAAAAFHVGTLQVHQFRSSNVSAHVVSAGGTLVRNDINALLDDEGGECNLYGLYLIGGEQHVDNHLRVEHARPHCDSREFFKGVLDGRARGAFTGRIVVHPDAQKTDAKQSNMSLLLSPHAQVDSKPQLEIFADDVKCTHGATIGQIDDEAIFYLRARGIGEAAARSLLIQAFAREALAGVRIEPLRRRLEELVLARLPEANLLQETA